MKLVCIGASYLFVHNVAKDLALTGEFEDSEIVVVDIVKESLDIVVEACKVIVSDFGSNIKVSGTLKPQRGFKKGRLCFSLRSPWADFRNGKRKLTYALNMVLGIR